MAGGANQVALSVEASAASRVWPTLNIRAVTACFFTGLLDDLYRFSPLSSVWEELAQDARPEARAQHRITALGGRIYLFGGLGNSGTPLSLDIKRWTSYLLI